MEVWKDIAASVDDAQILCHLVTKVEKSIVLTADKVIHGRNALGHSTCVCQVKLLKATADHFLYIAMSPYSIMESLSCVGVK